MESHHNRQVQTPENIWAEELWRIKPLARLIAHCCFPTKGLNWSTNTDSPSEAEQDWLQRLCRVQAAVEPAAPDGRGSISSILPRV